MTDDNILSEYQLQAEAARAGRVSERTIARKRREPNGIPWMEWGGKVYVHRAGYRDYLKRRIQRNGRR